MAKIDKRIEKNGNEKGDSPGDSMNLLHGLLPLPVIGGATLPERILNAIRLVRVYADSTESRILRDLVLLNGAVRRRQKWAGEPARRRLTSCPVK
jgi:hypothetical protein